jgi:hypothetical protein
MNRITAPRFLARYLLVMFPFEPGAKPSANFEMSGLRVLGTGPSLPYQPISSVSAHDVYDKVRGNVADPQWELIHHGVLTFHLKL